MLMRRALCWFCLWLLALSPALAGTSAGQAIAEHGSAAAPACASCHGANGQGMAAAGIPRLAGQNATYLAQQLANLSNGSRANVVMAPIAKALSSNDALAVSRYYASLPAAVVNQPEAALAPDSASIAAGRTLADEGLWSRQLPACADCHGASGLGVGAAFPALAGQSASYLAAQLLAYQQGTRKNDPLSLMQGVAARLSGAEISQLANYYASLPPAATKERHP